MKGSAWSAKVRLGLVIFAVLLVIEALEYVVGVTMSEGALWILVALAVPGAGLIVYYYMHIRQLWHSEE